MSKPEIRSIVFKNFSDKEFVCSWDGVVYRFAPGQEMYVEDWKAHHFTKHLVNKVMHEKGFITSNAFERKPLEAQALPSEKSVTVEEALDINKTEEQVEKKKGGRPKKVVEEEEFSGLKK